TYIRLSQELASAAKRLDEARKTAREEIVRRLKAGGAAAGGNRTGRSVEELITINKRYQERLVKVAKDYDEQFAKVQQMEVFSADLESRTAELQQIRVVTQELGAQLEHLNLEVNAQPRVT